MDPQTIQKMKSDLENYRASKQPVSSSVQPTGDIKADLEAYRASKQPQAETRESRIAQGLPVGAGSRVTPTAGGQLLRDIVTPAVKLGTSFKNLNQITSGEVPTDTKTNYLGSVERIGKGFDVTKGLTPENIRAMKDAVGTGAELASYLPVGTGIKAGVQIAKEPFKQAVKQSAKLLGKEGAVQGGLGEFGRSLQDDESLRKTISRTIGGTLIGGATGFGLGAGTTGISRGIANLKVPRINKIISQREKELANLDNQYSALRKASSFSKDAGVSSRKRVASTDVLVDSVDDTGTLRTKQPGGAVDQYRAQTIDGVEGTVRENLERLGERVSLNDVEKQLTKAVNQSGLEGSDLRNALNNIRKEIAGYRLKADADGKIPLTLVHDAKISTTKGINYLTAPEIKAYRKAIARGLKQTVEENSSFNTKEVNKELAKYYEDIALLERLDGRKVKGGKLGKYFAQISGNIIGGVAGGAVGGIPGSAIGTIVGGELAGRLKGGMLQRTLGGKTGVVAPKSKIIQEAATKGKSPRLMLPAPKPGAPRSQISSGKTINLPTRSQSSIDKVYSKSLGNRNTKYSNTITPSKIGIPKSIQQPKAKGKLPAKPKKLK